MLDSLLQEVCINIISRKPSGQLFVSSGLKKVYLTIKKVHSTIDTFVCFLVLGWVMGQQHKVCTPWPIGRKTPHFDKFMMLIQVERKALSLEKAHRDGAAVMS